VSGEWVEIIKTSLVNGDMLKAKDTEIEALREIIDSAIRSVERADSGSFEPLEAWWPAAAIKALKRLDSVTRGNK
jgi:hypothetical protein